MADTYLTSASRKEVWQAEFIQEYVRGNEFAPMTGTAKNMPIFVDRKLMGENAEIRNVPLRAKLTADGVTDNESLEGQEETLDNYNDQVTIQWRRHGVLVTKKENTASDLDFMDEAAPALRDWLMEKDRDQIIDTSCSPVIGGLTAYGDATEVQKDAWLVANQDRVLFGNATGNYSGDHSADLAKLDATNDTFTYANMRLAKRVMKLADPLIRPIRVDGKGWFYVAWAHTYAFRDFKVSLDTIHQNSRERGVGNPLYEDGDLIFENVIVKEVPEMLTVADVGDSGTVDISPVVYMGAQALLAVWKQMPSVIVKRDKDYNFRAGVAIEAARRHKKAFFNDKQHGCFTHYVAAQPD
jgi:N4-gp56 family major capsid protein